MLENVRILLISNRIGRHGSRLGYSFFWHIPFLIIVTIETGFQKFIFKKNRYRFFRFWQKLKFSGF
jgi:hypothetical protein